MKTNTSLEGASSTDLATYKHTLTPSKRGSSSRLLANYHHHHFSPSKRLQLHCRPPSKSPHRDRGTRCQSAYAKQSAKGIMDEATPASVTSLAGKRSISCTNITGRGQRRSPNIEPIVRRASLPPIHLSTHGSDFTAAQQEDTRKNMSRPSSFSHRHFCHTSRNANH